LFSFICTGKSFRVKASCYSSKGSVICRFHYINSVENYLPECLSGGFSVLSNGRFSTRFLFYSLCICVTLKVCACVGVELGVCVRVSVGGLDVSS
jgi:hypothetical protein